MRAFNRLLDATAALLSEENPDVPDWIIAAIETPAYRLYAGKNALRIHQRLITSRYSKRAGNAGCHQPSARTLL